jgi:mannose-1-phosphate guanylyltransferase
LGTGGAIKNCEPFLRSPRSFVFNGDIFTNLDLTRMLHAHQQSNALMSIALYEVEDPSRFGVIETNADNRIQSFTEKPPRELARSRDINAGIYIFERTAFDAFPSGPCSVERDVFPRLAAQGAPLFGYREWPYWTDLGTPADYLQAHQDILCRKIHMPLQYREVSPGIWLGEQTSIADTALIRPPVVLGDGVCITDGATVGPNAVLGRQVRVEPRALVEQSVIWDGATIRRDSVVQRSILGRCSEASGQVLAQVCEDYGCTKV